MAFTFTNYAGIPSPDSPWKDALNKAFQGYNNMVNSRYLEPNLSEELQKKKLYNQYYGKDIESQIGLRGAQTKQANAHTGLLGEQTRAANMHNQYLPDELKAQLQAKQLKAAQDQMFNQMLQQRISGGQMGNAMQGQPNPEYMPGQGNAPYMQQPDQAGLIQQEMSRKKQSSIDLSQEPQPTMDDIINKKFLNQDTFGPRYKAYLDNMKENIKIGQTEDKAFRDSLGKSKAKFYDDSVKSYSTLSNQDLALEELQNAAENNPEFRNVVGPIKKPLSYWLGTPEQKKLLGTLETSSGEIVLQIAPSFKGAWTGRDQSLVNQIKASPNDPADIFLGKLKAQRMINGALKERAKLQSQFISQGMTQLDATEKAAKLTPLNKYKPMVDSLINPKKNNGMQESDITKNISNEDLLSIAGIK